MTNSSTLVVFTWAIAGTAALVGCSGDLLVGEGKSGMPVQQASDASGPSASALSSACNFNAPALRAAQTGDCDENGWCWEDPIPTGAANQVASLPGAKELWLWSAHSLRRRVGNEWQAHSLPFETSMVGAFVRSDRDIWVAADIKAKPSQHALVYHFDGTEWSEAGDPADRYSVLHGTADGGLWAEASGADSGHLVSFDGSKWSVLEQPAPPSSSVPIRAYLPLSAAEIWVLRDQEIEHYQAGQWQQFAAPMGKLLSSLQRTSDGTVLAGGFEIDSGKAALFRIDGGQLLQLALPDLDGAISALAGTTATDLWIGTSSGTIQHFDGRGLTPSFNARHLVKEFAFIDAADIYALELDGNPVQVGGFAHYDGQHWDDGALIGNVYSLWGSANDDIWALTSGGRFHFDGMSWAPSPDAPGVVMPLSIWGSARDNVYQVSYDGEIQRFDGQSWSRVVQPSQYGEVLAHPGTSAVSASGPHDLWIADGFVWHYDGADLSRVSGDLKAVAIQAFASDDVWVTTHADLLHYDLLHYDGSTWASSGIPALRIWGTSSENLWAVEILDPRSPANGYLVSHFDGKAWKEYPPSYVPPEGDYPPYNELGDNVSALGGCDDYFWISSRNDLNLFDGQTWSTVLRGGPFIDAVWGLSPDTLIVGGEGGLLRRAK